MAPDVLKSVYMSVEIIMRIENVKRNYFYRKRKVGEKMNVMFSTDLCKKVDILFYFLLDIS